MAPEGSVPIPAVEPVMRGVPTATVTVDVALPTFPVESLKLNVTVVVPTGNSVVLLTATPPTRAGCCTGAGEMSSTAVAPARNAASAGEALLVAPPACVAGMEIAAGAVTTGAVLDVTNSLRTLD